MRLHRNCEWRNPYRDLLLFSAYFYDEWTLEYGEMFRVGMKSDIESYLRHVEFCLLSERNLEELFSVWVEMDSIRNPAMLYFLKLIMTSHDDKLSENDIRKFLMWLFPHPGIRILIVYTRQKLYWPYFACCTLNLEYRFFLQLLRITCIQQFTTNATIDCTVDTTSYLSIYISDRFQSVRPPEQHFLRLPQRLLLRSFSKNPEQRRMVAWL